MGASGSVTVYDYEKVINKYKEMYPDNDIFEDWWYLKNDNTLVVTLNNKKYILDYSDDQGYQLGTRKSFWFKDSEAQNRVLKVLDEVGFEDFAEVWT